MTLIDIVAGFAVGLFVGIGAVLFYIRWKMSRQLGMMQDQMEDMMDMTGGMGEELGDLEDIEVEPEEVEERKDEEEK